MGSRPTPSEKTYTCLLLPADGSTPKLLDYTTRPPVSKSYDRCFDVSADLRKYWHGDYLARIMQTFGVGDYIIPALDGQYIIYYNTDSSRPANKTLLSMPLVRDAIAESTRRGESFEERIFYRGDVFVVRLSELWETNFESNHDDISPDMVEPLIELLEKGFFMPNWRAKFLERQSRDDEAMNKDLQKHEDIRGKLVSKLSPAQQESPDVKQLTDFLAALALLEARK